MQPAPHPPQFYGRRKGRALTAHQAGLVERRLPELRLPAIFPADLRKLFAAPVDEVRLEIGFGGGEHLAWAAATSPTTGFIGCEPFVNGVAKLLAIAGDLPNLRIHDGDVRPILVALPPASVARVTVLFPDPWPKARHAARRLFNAELLAGIDPALASGGTVVFATDDAIYWDEALAVLADARFTICERHEWCDEAQRGVPWPPTRFEARAIRDGRICRAFIAQKDRA